jgi:serine/threonine protein kinase
VFFCRSFSYVFEASNTADSHRYAIKKMSCHTNEEERRTRDEVENYQRFSHPNLGLIRNYS